MSGARLRWIIAGAVALVVVLLVLPLFRAPPAPPPAAPRPKPGVQLDTSPALREEAWFFDPKPLFLPTAGVNAAPPPVRHREPGAAFPDYDAKLGFSDAGLKLSALDLPPPVAVPARAADKPGEALALDSPGPLALGLGRAEAPVPALAARGGRVEIYSAATGRRVLARDLAGARPPGDSFWQPVQFLAAVDAAGLVGPLVILPPRSGVEEVDRYLQNYLTRTLRVGERLAPGFYRICVGP